MIMVASILGGVLLAILLYDFSIYLSMRREEKNRLEDSTVRETLAEIWNQGNSLLPACLLLHGFGGSPYDLKPLAQALATDDRTVLAPCLAGHCGESVREMRKASQHEWLEGARGAFERLRKGHRAVDIVGFSLGGLLALDLAKESSVRRVVLINPYTHVTYRWFYILSVRRWQGLLGIVIPYVRKIRPGQINDPAGRDRYQPSYMHVPIRSYAELTELSDSVWDTTGSLDKPLFFIYSMGDIVSSPSRMADYSRKLCAGAKDRVLRLERSNHVLLYDYDRNEIVSSVLEFLASGVEEEQA